MKTQFNLPDHGILIINAWKSFKLSEKYLLIKYEDLVNNTEEIFLKILNFI